MDASLKELSPLARVLSCLGLAILFVSSLYVVDTGLPRNHPKTVRRRMAVITIVCFIAPLYLWLCLDSNTDSEISLLGLLGIRSPGLLAALSLPPLLVLLLYAGPVFQTLSGGDSLLNDIVTGRVDLRFRTYIFAPFAEEFVFRACMLPILLPWLGVTLSVVVCPLFFGLAHIHHILEWYRLKSRTPFSTALLVVVVQFCYTSVFGMFSAFLFVRTGHLISPVICHVLCNVFGLPSIDTISTHPYKFTVYVTYALGAVLFLVLLLPLTDPKLYNVMYL